MSQASNLERSQSKSRLRFEALLADLSARFVDLPDGKVAPEIELAQRQLCEALGVERCGLWLESQEEPGAFILRYLHQTSAILPVPPRPDARTLFPWTLQQVLRGEVHVTRRLADLPAEAARDREVCERFGIKSHLAFPLSAGGAVFGALSFAAALREWDWPPEVIQRLRLIADVFASALARVQAQAQARKAADDWRSTFDGIQDSVVVLTPALQILRANSATASFLGLPLAAIQGRTCHELFHGSTCPVEGCPSVRAIQTRQHQEAEIFIESRQTWLLVTCDPILDSQGNLTGVVHVAKDITGKRAAETALSESQAQLLALVESTNDLIWCVDAEKFGLIRFNSGLRDHYLKQYGLEIRRGMTPKELLGAGFSERWHRLYRRALQEGSFSTEYVSASENNYLLLSLNLLKRGGEVFGISVFGKDITAQQESETQLEKLRERLAHASRVSVLSHLASAVAHELNQPLGAILSNADAAELLLQHKQPPLDEVRDILADIRKDDLRASEVIRRMRRLLKRREPELATLSLNDVVNEAVTLVRPEAAARRVTIEVELASGLPPVIGDRVQLEQVLLNLTVNSMDAVAGNPPEERRLLVRSQSSGTGMVEVAVSDCGQGFPAGSLPRLFESFHSTKPDGLGVGLAISCALIEAHGGRIQAENNPERGATVRFLLPVVGGPRGGGH